MNTALYELVFYGELVPGIPPEQVRKNVAELFKASVEQVERMFVGQRVVIRNKLDAETAQKYVVAMQKRGAICRIEPTPGTELKPAGLTPARQLETPVRPAIPTGVTPMANIPAGRLRLAGVRTDTVLQGKDFSVAPVGARLSDEVEVMTPVFEHLDEIELAPLGSNMQDDAEDIPVSVPDISHLRLE
jgi:hypothetical protein